MCIMLLSPLVKEGNFDSYVGVKSIENYWFQSSYIRDNWT